MRYIRRIIYFLGICDLYWVVQFSIDALVYGEVPLYRHIKYIVESFQTSPDLIKSWIIVGLSILELSMMVSCYLLLRQNRFAATICYFQTPFRLLLNYTSIPFIQPLYIAGNSWFNFLLLLMIESAKIAIIVIWQYNKLYLKSESKPNEPKDMIDDINTETFKM